MIPIKKAVQSAIEHLNEIYEGEDIQGVLIEETIASDDDQYWYITLSFYIPSKKPKIPLPIFSGSALAINDYYIHEYKKFTIDGDDGRCLAMEIRKFDETK